MKPEIFHGEPLQFLQVEGWGWVWRKHVGLQTRIYL
jgi:hypothetical protein